MPVTEIIFYKEGDIAPLRDWLRNEIPKKAALKCLVRLERLAELGHELRRPEADYLREGICELRVGFQGVNYRILYFFYGKDVVVLTHGLTKKREVPPKEIDLALERKRKYECDPKKHTLEIFVEDLP